MAPLASPRPSRVGILIVGFVAALVTGPPQIQGNAGEGDSSIWWEPDLDAVKAELRAEGTITLPIGDNETRVFEMTHTPLYPAGYAKVIHRNERGGIISEKPIEWKAWKGHLQGDPTSEALLGVDDFGIYGHVTVDGRTIRYDAEEDENGNWSTRIYGKGLVAKTDQHKHFDLAVEMAQPTSSDSAATASDECDVYGGIPFCEAWVPGRTIAVIQVWADEKFVTEHDNFASRISNALVAQRDMWFDLQWWDSQSGGERKGIQIIPLSVQHQDGFSIRDEDGVADQNDQWVSFIQTPHPENNNEPYAEPKTASYLLFSGANLGEPSNTGVNGNWYIYGISRNVGGSDGELGAPRYAIVESVDFPWWTPHIDQYDPDETHNLAVAVAHELGHNWGRKTHVTDMEDDSYSIMNSGVDPDDIGLWTGYYSQQSWFYATEDGMVP